MSLRTRIQFDWLRHRTWVHFSPQFTRSETSSKVSLPRRAVWSEAERGGYPEGRSIMGGSLMKSCVIESAEIDTPGDLQVLLKRLKDAVATGALEHYWPEDAMLASEARIEDIPSEGPWPDYLELYFRSNAGAQYKLEAETYHGAGGRWYRVEQP